MSERHAPESGASESAVPAARTAKAAPRRTSAVVLWGLAILAFLLVAAWILGGVNPSLAPGGVSWHDAAFVEPSADEASSDEQPTWTAWDLDTGAKASVLMRNDRPYPITVAPGPANHIVRVEIAGYDPDGATASVSPDFLTTTPRLHVPAGGYVVVIMQVSDRCFPMEAGSATGNDVAVVEVTTFGITRGLEVQFPGTYMAGTTTGHQAAACSPASRD